MNLLYLWLTIIQDDSFVTLKDYIGWMKKSDAEQEVQMIKFINNCIDNFEARGNGKISEEARKNYLDYGPKWVCREYLFNVANFYSMSQTLTLRLLYFIVKT